MPSAEGAVDASAGLCDDLQGFSGCHMDLYRYSGRRVALKYFLRFAPGITVHFAGEAKFKELI
jgi:hypothetical protein